jgi:hypothetical protein
LPNLPWLDLLLLLHDWSPVLDQFQPVFGVSNEFPQASFSTWIIGVAQNGS